MGAPYTAVTISGYNSNPPTDDGAQTEANRGKYATIKTKLGDPVKTLAETINTNISTAFGKVVGGAGVTSTAISYQVLSTDQAKLVRATAASITITTPSATDVASPFVFSVRNDSSGSITLDGSGSQTIDGTASLTLSATEGVQLYTDGTNWFSVGRSGVSVFNAGFALLNGTIAASVASSALTIAIKGNDGNDPSAGNPVYVVVRNVTAATGSFTLMSLTAATSLVISSGSTMGAGNSSAFRLWIVGFNDGGTFRLGAINCLSGLNIFPLSPWSIASSTAEGGAGGADSAFVFYTGTAVSAKPYQILGYVTYESGLATAGTYNVVPTRIQLYGLGVPLPGQSVQVRRNDPVTLATGTTVIPYDDTIPQNTEGDEYITQAITPSSAANVLRIESQAMLSFNADQAALIASIFQDSTANALATSTERTSGAGELTAVRLYYGMLAQTTSATTFKIRGGCPTAGTTTFNGSVAARLFGAVLNSSLSITEIMA